MEKGIKNVTAFLKNSLKWLLDEDCGCCTYKLDCDWGVCVGWSGGFDETDKNIYHSKEAPHYGIVVGLKLWNTDTMRTDYDYIDFAVFENGDVCDIETAISPKENITALAKWLLDTYYNIICEYDLDDNGILTGKQIEKIA